MTATTRTRRSPSATHPATADSPAAVLARAVTEKQLQANVIQCAKLYGWLVFHAYDSRRSEPGFPDLVLAHPCGRLLFAELKTERGKLSAAQEAWLETLVMVTRVTWRYGAPDGAVGVYVWRPRDWHSGLIESVLAHRTRSGGAA